MFRSREQRYSCHCEVLRACLEMKKRITPIAMEIAMYCHEKMQGKNVSTKIKKWTPIVMEIATHCNERIQGGISVTKE